MAGLSLGDMGRTLAMWKMMFLDINRSQLKCFGQLARMTSGCLLGELFQRGMVLDKWEKTDGCISSISLCYLG